MTDLTSIRVVRLSGSTSNQLYKKYIAVDIDKPGSAFLWDDKGLPPPSIITINPENTHCHYLWEIKTPVIYTEKGRLKPQKWMEVIDSTITSLLGADMAYGGLITKKPQHKSWKTIIHSRASYDLDDFGEYFDIQPSRKNIALHEKGRNNTLFTAVYKLGRKTAFKHSSQESLESALVAYGESINVNLSVSMAAICHGGLKPEVQHLNLR